MMGRTVAKCGKCGLVAEIQGDGLCKRCYGQAWRAKSRPGNSTPAVLTMECMFSCKKYRCRMAVKYCLDYQEMAAQQSDSDYFRAGELIRDRRPCLDCEQGKVIAASIGKKQVASMIEPQNTAKDRRSDVSEGRCTKGTEIVQPGANATPILANDWVGETMKTEVEEMKETKNTIRAQPVLNKPVTYAMPVMCRKCGKHPATNPVNGLCGACLSELGKEGYAKRGQKHDWLKWGLRDHPELYEQIKYLGDKDFRTPELEALFLLSESAWSKS